MTTKSEPNLKNIFHKVVVSRKFLVIGTDQGERINIISKLQAGNIDSDQKTCPTVKDTEILNKNVRDQQLLFSHDI